MSHVPQRIMNEVGNVFSHYLFNIPIDVMRRFRGINGYVMPFRRESNAWEKKL